MLQNHDSVTLVFEHQHMFIFRYTIEEINNMMEQNTDGNMEFPRDILLEDCFSNMAEPLYGFVTNVTLIEDEPCVLNTECFENGTRITEENFEQSNLNRTRVNVEDLGQFFLQKRQGNNIFTMLYIRNLEMYEVTN